MADQQDYLRNLYAQLLAAPRNAWGWANQQMADPQVADAVRFGTSLSSGGVTPAVAGNVANRIMAPAVGRAVAGMARYGLNALNPTAAAQPPTIVPSVRNRINDAISQLQATQSGP
jgi:hypothetical protein